MAAEVRDGSAPAPGLVRTARLLGLTGLCAGFGLVAVAGIPPVRAPSPHAPEVLAPASAGEKGGEIRFLVLAVAAAAAGSGLGIAAGVAAGAPVPAGEVLLVAGLAAAAAADGLLPAVPAAAPWLLVLGVGLSVAGMTRRPALRGAAAPPIEADRAPAGSPGWVAWCGVLGGLIWLHHDPMLHDRSLDLHHEGTHLAYVSHLAAGRWPGDRLALIYGPLYEFSLLAWMKVCGWTVAAERGYFTAAQVAGGLCAFAVLTRVCLTTAGAVLGLVLVHLFTVSGLVWYGWANGLRAGSGLAALVLTVDVVFGRRPRPWWAAGCGALLALAFCYSQESGGAALLALAATIVTSAAAGPGRFLRPALAVAAGWGLTLAAVLGLLFSGPLRSRLASLFLYSSAQFGSFMAIAFPLPEAPRTASTAGWIHYAVQWPWLAWGLPALCAVLLVWMAAARGAGRSWTARDVRLIAVSGFGGVSLTSALHRSDFWHVLAAGLAGVVLAAVAVEWSVLFIRDLMRRRSPAGLRAAYGTVLIPAWIAGAAFIANRAVQAWDSDQTVWGSRIGVVRPRLTAERLRGWQVPFDHPRSGGLTLIRPQRDDLYGVLACLDRWTSPGEPVFMGSGAEAVYFLADRACPNPTPVSLAAYSVEGFERIAASLSACRVLVVSRRFIVDSRPWDAWEPPVAQVVRRDFVPRWTGFDFEVWVRR